MCFFKRRFSEVSKKVFGFLFAVALLTALSTDLLWSCACGCGVFDVGTSGLLPMKQGGMVYLEYDYMNQNKNWHGSSKAPAENNEDKRIRTSFYTAGGQYMFNRTWGFMADVPYADRSATMSMDDGMGGEMEMTHSHSSLGDIRLRGIYTGFSPDLSSGLTFGAKLPTGSHDYENFDRDMQIGTGSTDLLFGAFHRGYILSTTAWGWFTNAQLAAPLLVTPNYHPGAEIDAVLGAYYNDWKIGGVKVAPLAQVIGAIQGKDTGSEAAPDDTGFNRLMMGPGLEVKTGRWRLYGDMSFPIYQWVRGNQLVGSAYYKINLGRAF